MLLFTFFNVNTKDTIMSWKNNKLSKIWKQTTTGGKVLYGLSATCFTLTTSLMFLLNKAIETPDTEQKAIVAAIALFGYLGTAGYAWGGSICKKLTKEEQEAQDKEVQIFADNIRAERLGGNLISELNIPVEDEPNQPSQS